MTSDVSTWSGCHCSCNNWWESIKRLLLWWPSLAYDCPTRWIETSTLVIATWTHESLTEGCCFFSEDISSLLVSKRGNGTNEWYLSCWRLEINHSSTSSNDWSHQAECHQQEQQENKTTSWTTVHNLLSGQSLEFLWEMRVYTCWFLTYFLVGLGWNVEWNLLL